jgi:hypothetical protein
MMFAFLYTYVYKNEVFAITDCGEIWRLRFVALCGPELSLLVGDELEFYPVTRLLRSMKDLYS